MLQTCLNIDIIYVLLGNKFRALSTRPHDFLSPFLTIFIDYDILQQQLSMIAFSYGFVLVIRLR